MAFCSVEPPPFCMLSAAGSIQPTSCSSKVPHTGNDMAKKINEVDKDLNNLPSAKPKLGRM